MESILCAHRRLMTQKPPCLTLLSWVATFQSRQIVVVGLYAMSAIPSVYPHQPTHQTASLMMNISSARTSGLDGSLMSSTVEDSGIASATSQNQNTDSAHRTVMTQKPQCLTQGLMVVTSLKMFSVVKGQSVMNAMIIAQTPLHPLTVTILLTAKTKVPGGMKIPIAVSSTGTAREALQLISSVLMVSWRMLMSHTVWRVTTPTV